MSNVIIVGGVGYGDESKGTIVDYLSEKYNPGLFVRYNGGSQALHHVVRPDGMIHGFKQIGSGTLACSKARTYLSRFMVVNPFFLHQEINELTIQKGLKYHFGQIIIDRDCVVVTPFHRLINQMLEISKGDEKFGSCGHGIGEAIKDSANGGDDVLLAGDLIDRQKTIIKLRHILASKIDLGEQLLEDVDLSLPLSERASKLIQRLAELKGYSSWLDRLAQDYSDLFKFGFFKYGDSKTLKQLLGKTKTVIFEGAQGALLDPVHGFVPYVTKTRTNFDNADKLLSETGYKGEVTKVGVMRAYATRHGVGPFVTEDTRLFPGIWETHNGWNEWQEKFRIGWPDLVATRYALDIVGKVDYLAVTNLDRFMDFHRMFNMSNIRVCNSYSTHVDKSDPFLNAFFQFNENPKSQTIKRIKIPEEPKPDQVNLAGLLNKCRPIYKRLPGLNEQTYVNFLEEQLGLKVRILSFGPTHKDKVEI